MTLNRRAARSSAALVSLLLARALLAAGSQPQRGNLLLIGGGKRPRAVMEKFIELAGGPAASILIVPTASMETDTIDFYRKELTGLGAKNVTGLDVRGRADASKASFVELVDKAGGVFFAGGDQRRIVAAFRDTPVGEAIERAYRRGAAIGGTSAGTACMSPLMLTGEGDFGVVKAKNIELSPGLGLFPGAILDQHFVARQRQNRLIAVVLEHPEYLGIGVDESTAVWLKSDGTFEVLGQGWVVVYDAAAATITRGRGDASASLGARNLRTHLLLPGDSYDLATRTVLPETPAVRAPATEGVPAAPVPVPVTVSR